MRALTVLVACLGLGAAPVPRERPLAPADLAGQWVYKWNDVPGLMWLGADGSYAATYGGYETVRYAGAWWVERGRVVLVEYPVCAAGMQRGQPVRYEFAATRTGDGFKLTANVTVTLTQGSE